EDLGLACNVINGAVATAPTKWLILAGDFDGILVVDTETRQPVKLLLGTNGSALSLVMSSNGKRIAAEDIWGKVCVFGAEAGDLLLQKNLFRRLARDVALSADGTMVAASSNEGTAIAVDGSAQKEQLFAGHDLLVHGVSFGP